MIGKKSLDIPRRQLIKLAGLASASAISSVQANPVNTPSASEGPYYPTPSMRHTDIDNDLVKIADKTRQAGGEIITLKGIVTNAALLPLSGIRVEIWQCDVNGRYLHTRDRNSATPDSGFQGFGHTLTNANGEYEFRTIKPVSYPGRAPHIHVKLFKDEKVFTTQFYVKDHADNSQDVLHRRMSVEEQKAVEMEFSSLDDNVEAVINIIC